MDQFAQNVFESMGYKKPTPTMEKLYSYMKLRRDRVMPGRLSADAMALIAMFAGVIDGEIDLSKSEQAKDEKVPAKKGQGE